MNPLIQQYLTEDLREVASTYMIPDQFISQIPDIITMMLKSNSIENREDKQNRFNLLPLMNEDQITRLREILTKEKNKLAEIEAKYSNTKNWVWANYIQKREDTNYIAKMNVIKKAEAQHNAQEHSEADALLENL